MFLLYIKRMQEMYLTTKVQYQLNFAVSQVD